MPAAAVCVYRPGPRSSLFLDRVEQAFGLARRRVEFEGALQLSAGGGWVAGGEIGFGERDPGGGGLLAPDRDLQRVDGIFRPARTEEDPAHQQVGGGLVW